MTFPPDPSPAAYAAQRRAIGSQAKAAALLGLAKSTLARRELGQLPISREAWLALHGLTVQVQAAAADRLVQLVTERATAPPGAPP